MINFNKKYNPELFSSFLYDFLPEDYTEKEKDITETKGCKIIKDAKELGYCESLNVHVLEMSHTKETDPRVTIATDAFRILATYGVDKALVIFKNDETENYRFSYLTISLDVLFKIFEVDTLKILVDPCFFIITKTEMETTLLSRKNNHFNFF